MHIPDRERLEIPIREVERILIFGRIQLSTPVVNACLEHKIGVFYLNRSGEFRSPIVDTLVMKLINSSTFKLDDFETGLLQSSCELGFNSSTFKLDDFETVATTGGVYLNSTARRSFFRHFENRMSEEILHPDLLAAVSYRYAIQLQVRRYKRSLFADGVKYMAFVRES